MKYMIYLIFLVSLCYAQTKDTVIVVNRVPKTYYETTKIITITNTIIKVDTLVVRDYKYTQSKIDSTDLFWKNLIILTKKELQEAIEAWSKRRDIKLYD